MYEIKTQNFEGPLSLLLQLIEQEKLDITNVSLAHVADQYLERIDYLGDQISTTELADFLVVASRLLLIKSYVLLPNLRDEEEHGDSLEAQLKIYKIYFDASKHVRKLISKNQFSFARLPVKITEQEFSPPPALEPNNLSMRLHQLLTDLEKTFIKLPKRKMVKVISIGERIYQLKTLLSSVERVGFAEFLKSAKNKSEIVVSFLALLELIKQKHLIAEQEQNKILITRA